MLGRIDRHISFISKVTQLLSPLLLSEKGNEVRDCFLVLHCARFCSSFNTIIRGTCAWILIDIMAAIWAMLGLMSYLSISLT
jgi:hypothetical protein